MLDLRGKLKVAGALDFPVELTGADARVLGREMDRARAREITACAAADRVQARLNERLARKNWRLFRLALAASLTLNFVALVILAVHNIL